MWIVTLIFTSCSKSDVKDDDFDGICDLATAEDFSEIRDAALEELTQNFQFNAEDGSDTFTSENGVEITINGSCY